MKETMSNWEAVSEHISTSKIIELGERFSSQFFNNPTKLLNSISYYKFASKMIGSSKRVLDLSCGEGMGSYLMAKECGIVKGIDSNSSALNSAKNNFEDSNLKFSSIDSFNIPQEDPYDALVCFNLMHSWSRYLSVLKPEGLAILGTEKQNLKFLEREIKCAFHNTFFFAATSEVIHADSLDFAEYILAIGCNRKS